MSKTRKSILYDALPSETNAIITDSFDVAAFGKMKDAAEALQGASIEGNEILKTFDPLMQDVFGSLFKNNPKKRNAGDIKESHQLNHDMISKSMLSEQYKRLRQYTKLDDVNSALATVTIAKELIPVIKDTLAAQAEQANKLKEAEDGLENAQNELAEFEAGNGAGSGPGNGAQTNAERKAELNKSLKQAKSKYSKGVKAANDTTAAKQEIRQAMRKASQTALNEVEEMSEMVGMWGTDAGEMQALNPEQRIRLAQRINDSHRLKELAKVLGRFKRLAIGAQATKVKHGFDEVFDITLGNDLNRVVPSELMLLRNPATKQEFARRFAEGKLMQYDLRGKESVGKGPIICCLDSSGSMSLEQDIWTKAVALSLMEIAHRQKRAFAAIHFGSHNDPLKTVYVKKGEGNTLRKVIDIAEYYLGGGTDFEKPLNKAMEIVECNEFNKADIVFITDGSCGVDDSWLQDFKRRRDEKGVRVNTVLIDAGQTSDYTVREFSNTVSLSSELSADSAVEIFGAV